MDGTNRTGDAPSDTADRKTAEEFDAWIAMLSERLQESDSGHVNVYVRSMLPPAGAKVPQVALYQRVERLVEETLTPFEHVSLNVWGERLCLCDTCQSTAVGRAMLDTVRKFDAWGSEFDASIGPFFEDRYIESGMTGETHEGIVPPRITVALYLDESLVGVFPCRMADQVFSVADCCDVLEDLSSRRPADEPAVENEREADADTPPDGNAPSAAATTDRRE